MKNASLITDHAFVRYAERVEGLDIDAMKSHIATPDIVAAIRGGATALKKNNFTYVIGNGKLVTVVRGNRKVK